MSLHASGWGPPTPTSRLLFCRPPVCWASSFLGLLLFGPSSLGLSRLAALALARARATSPAQPKHATTHFSSIKLSSIDKLIRVCRPRRRRRRILSYLNKPSRSRLQTSPRLRLRTYCNPCLSSARVLCEPLHPFQCIPDHEEQDDLTNTIITPTHALGRPSRQSKSSGKTARPANSLKTHTRARPPQTLFRQALDPFLSVLHETVRDPQPRDLRVCSGIALLY